MCQYLRNQGNSNPRLIGRYVGSVVSGANKYSYSALCFSLPSQELDKNEKLTKS
jgi:hypothetical protein